jgi:SAM-dependent methyltransferase
MANATAEQAKKDFEEVSGSYNGFLDLPYYQLISQLIKVALGDCTNMAILDLAGGSGLHARDAVELGASSVDVVDISSAMLKVGEDFEANLGRKGVMRFFEADVSKSLSQIPLREDGYDVVMGNWLFNHAASIDMLEGMFHNIVDHLKPGGLFVGVRGADITAGALRDGKYGATYKNMKIIPGGIEYTVVLHCTPQIEFHGSFLNIIASGSTEMHRKFGLTNVHVVPYECTKVVQSDPEFWETLIQRPAMAVVRATKR